MRWMSLILLTAIVMAPGWGRAENVCGEDGLVCEQSERCCEHVIAAFAGDHAASPPYIQGQCIPQEQKCTDFWCGNEQCKGGFFGTPSVCCTNVPSPGAAPQYSCAYSELSCPGNTQRLSIRDNQPNRTLRRS